MSIEESETTPASGGQKGRGEKIGLFQCAREAWRVRRKWHELNPDVPLSPPLLITFGGFSAVFSQELGGDIFRKEDFSERMAVCTQFTETAIALNDLLDIGLREEISNREGKSRVVKRNEWRGITHAKLVGDFHKARKGLKESLLDLPPLEAQKFEGYVKEYFREISFIEIEARKRSSGSWNSDLIAEYKELVNGILTAMVISAFLGPEKLGRRLRPIEGKITWDKVREKYQWLLEGVDCNQFEEKVRLLFLLSMGAQIYDDYWGVKTDRELGVETFATVALRETGGSKTKTWLKLQDKAREYYGEARELGFGLVTTKLVAALSNIGQIMITKNIRSPFTGKREKAVSESF